MLWNKVIYFLFSKGFLERNVESSYIISKNDKVISVISQSKLDPLKKLKCWGVKILLILKYIEIIN